MKTPEMKLNCALARPYACKVAKLVFCDPHTLGILCAIYLRFIKSFLIDFLVESLGDRSTLEDTVLAVEEPVFKGELCEREADDEALPWEERPVKPAGQALE